MPNKGLELCIHNMLTYECSACKKSLTEEEFNEAVESIRVSLLGGKPVPVQRPRTAAAIKAPPLPPKSRTGKRRGRPPNGLERVLKNLCTRLRVAVRAKPKVRLTKAFLDEMPIPPEAPERRIRIFAPGREPVPCAVKVSDVPPKPRKKRMSCSEADVTSVGGTAKEGPPALLRWHDHDCHERDGAQCRTYHVGRICLSKQRERA